jgi:FhaA, N-terminal domain/FHA domain
MNALSRFEGFMQELMDRRVVQMLGGSLQPVELAHGIGRCMEAQQRTDTAVPVAPNHFRVLVSPIDYADIRELDPSIEHSLATYAVELARERGFNFEAAPEVQLAADADLRRGELRVHGLIEPPRASAARHSADGRYGYQRPGFVGGQPASPPESPLGLELAAPEGEVARLPVDHFPFAIGRMEGNDLVLPDPHVSRNHAQIEQHNGHYRLRDLSSRNGTHLNGQPIAEAELNDGDQLAIGVFEATVRIKEER